MEFSAAALANARFLIPFISLPHGACRSAAARKLSSAERWPLRIEALIGFCPRRSAFKTAGNPQTL